MRARSMVAGVGVALATGVVVVAGAWGAGSGVHAAAGLPKGGEPVVLKPAEFTTRIDNPYWPMKPGTRWVYRETDPEGNELRVVVRVTNQVKRIANGITARVIRDGEGRPGRGHMGLVRAG